MLELEMASELTTTYSPILPGLSDDVAILCLALVPRHNLPAMAAVCKRWRSAIQSPYFFTVRKQAHQLQEWLYVLTTTDADNHDDDSRQRWEVLIDPELGNKHHILPPMPAPNSMAGFGVVTLHGKLLLMGGSTTLQGNVVVSAQVYQYHPYLNWWSKLANMNESRYDFACAEVNGMVYAVGGRGASGESLSTAELYNPATNTWTLIDPLRRPRWGCFACVFHDRLYVMGGRSSFTIGNSKFVDVYDPESRTWCEMKKGCVMVTAHAVLGEELFCMEWKSQRKLAVFNPKDGSWRMVQVPLTGSSSIGFRFGVLGGKLLLFSVKEDPQFRTMVYDPGAEAGSEWSTSDIKPSRVCLCSVTIKA